jgi:hypothetical protein
MPTDYHNKGQTDASNGVNDRPHSHTEELFTWTGSGTAAITQDRADYKAGQDNHDSQKSK